jgi:vacuolar-type H+-ATPase subunit C/Vma6
MKRRPTKMIGSWRYAAGRIRSLEVQLLDRAALDRLAAAEDSAQLMHILEEAGYRGRTLDEMLGNEAARLDTLIREVSPDPEFADILLLEQDGHNIKLVLREKASPDNRPFERYADLFLDPSSVRPKQLDMLIREGKLSELPAALAKAAEAGRDAYSESYDTARLDVAVDKAIAEAMLEEADRLENVWFSEYLTAQRDLKNLETLYRARRREMGRALYEDSLLPDGVLKKAVWKSLYDADVSEILEVLEKTPYRDLAPAFEKELQGEQGDFSLLADSFLIRHLRKARGVLSGPEIPLAYVLSRLFEMKTARLMAAAVRHGIPVERRRKAIRPPYLDRR